MTFVRVFVNYQSTEMYTTLFREVFRIIGEQTGQPVKWQHLHQSGFGCIVMDMDSMQMSGNIINIFLIHINILTRL